MAQVSKTAVSKLIKEKRGEDDLDDESKKRSRDDFKKQKELEEQRKLGNAPAAVDESGKDINPHIPQYISEAPWYLDPEGPTLRHQRQQEEKVQTFSGIDEWYKKGVVGALRNKQVDACAELATNCAELNGLPQSLARTGVISFALLGLSVCLPV